VEDGGMRTVLIAQIRDWNLLKEVPLQNSDLFIKRVVPSLLFGHGVFLPLEQLSHMEENSNSVRSKTMDQNWKGRVK
jgi:hypothetical protein